MVNKRGKPGSVFAFVILFLFIIVFLIRLNFQDTLNIIRSLSSIDFIVLSVFLFTVVRGVKDKKIYKRVVAGILFFLALGYLLNGLYLYKIRTYSFGKFGFEGILTFFGFSIVPTLVLFIVVIVPLLRDPKQRNRIITGIIIFVIAGHFLFLLLLIIQKWQTFLG